MRNTQKVLVVLIIILIMIIKVVVVLVGKESKVNYLSL